MYLDVATLERKVEALTYLDVATLERKTEALTYLDVATLERKAEASLFVLDEVQRHLGVAFLLEVGNDALANQLSIAHHV